MKLIIDLIITQHNCSEKLKMFEKRVSTCDCEILKLHKHIDSNSLKQCFRNNVHDKAF